MPRRNSSEAKEKGNGKASKRPRRRRRILGGNKKPSRSSDAHNKRDNGRAVLTDGVMYGVASWLWHATNVLNWNTVGIEGEGGGEGRLGRTVDMEGERVGLSQASGQAAGVTLALGLAAAGFYLVRRNNGANPEQPNQVDQDDGGGAGDEQVDDTRQQQQPQGRARTGDGDDKTTNGRSSRSGPRSGGAGGLSPKQPVTPEDENCRTGATPQDHKTNGMVVSSAPASRSGERRVSLYDVLTGDAPLPPRGERATTANGVVGAGGASSGVHPSLGGARRASIFDRIADVVFNEEQKEKNPVDAVAVRAELDEEFPVSFREGAMGMTLSMDPDSRDAFVGKVSPHGQAYRAGVHPHDLVIGVGEHNVSSYGTVLAFMNIMGRPIELRFRKGGDSCNGDGGGGGSGANGSATGGGAVATSDKGAKGAGGAGGETGRDVFPVTAASGASAVSTARKIGARGKTAHHAKLKMPLSPISPRKPSKLRALGQEVASSDASFSVKMEHGVVVTKYGKKGAPAQRVLFLDAETKSVAWRELDARSPGHHRATSLTNLIKGQREALALSHLIEVVAGDESDPTRPSTMGSPLLREHCDDTLLERSFALQFKERSLEMTCDSQAEMRQLVAGFRDLQHQYGS